MYDSKFHVPKYSSLVVGQWDTLTELGGGNTEMYGLYKTSKGIVAVGRHIADTLNNSIGNSIPTTNAPTWGVTTPSNESAILVYYIADSLNNADDHIATGIQNIHDHELEIIIFPNPVKDIINIEFATQQNPNDQLNYILYNIVGQPVKMGRVENNTISIDETSKGIYFLELYDSQIRVVKKIIFE
jgi:hypothetical protein